MIKDVTLTPLNIMFDDKGCVLHMMKSTLSCFNGFGEVYFSEIIYGKFKGWKLHKTQTQNICVPSGAVRFYLYDGRDSSESYGATLIVEISRIHNYQLITIPPGVWYGFQGCANGVSLLANIVDFPHEPTESIKLPIDTSLIPMFISHDF